MTEDRSTRRWRALLPGTLLAALLLATFGIGTVSALTWQSETVASMEMTGISSLALNSSGNPRISYLDVTNFDLLYAWNDGSGWHTETAVAEGDVGFFSSLALDSSDKPRISYFDGTNEGLKYAWNGGAGWHNETVDAEEDVGEFSSLALDRFGNPRISYHNSTSKALKYAWNNGSGWQNETVDAAGGGLSSLALTSTGSPRISYYNGTAQDGDLKYAWMDGSGWHNETVDAEGDVGAFPSLALDSSGNPRISYYDHTNEALKYAWNDGSGWHTVTADPVSGWFSSLALDSAGNPRISYYDSVTTDIGSPVIGDLKYAWNDGSGWQKETVDADLTIGIFSTAPLALDRSGNPRISYYDGTHHDLKYAWAALSPVPTPTSAGSSASFAAYPQSGPAPHLVQFLDYTPNAKSWSWDFGDNGSSTLQYPTHQYNRSGLYSVTLSVTDWSDRTETKTQYHLIRVTEPVTPAPTPVANFSANATAGAAPLAVQFTDESSPAPYHRWWTFGDGSSSTDANPVHTYSRAGSYTVNLTAWTAIGTASTTGTITVGPDARAPVANFTMSRSSGTAPLYVKFTDASTGAPTTWRWSFGGLAWTTATNPSVVFRQPGEYAITLTATNAYGSSTATRNVTVTGAMPRSVRGSAVSIVG